MKVALTTAALGLLVGSTQAYKDDSYYIAGTGNPNVNEGMYWKDAENVFQDLGAFQELYVEYHNCAWTWMQTSDEDNDIDENDYWYMGKIPPSGANVAFSLYGSLSGTSFSGCTANTFINSFYTNTGFTDFTKAMNYAGVSGFSSSYSYNTGCSGGYGVGCDWDNGFAVHTYSSNECDPQNYKGVKDTMSSLNSALNNNAKCVKIYDKSSYGGTPYGTPLQLLAYSHSCFYQDFFSPDGVCPDPYGKLAYYQQNFYKGIQNSKKQDPYQVARRKVQYEAQIEMGERKSMIGLGLAALATLMMFYDFVWWLCAMCCCPKKAKKPKRMPPKEVPPPVVPSRSDDFILSTRGGSVDKDDATEEEYSQMDDTPISDVNDIEAPPAAYTPPAADYEPLPSPLDLHGKETLSDVADQDAPVTTYAPPALFQTDDVMETPAGKDTDIIMNPTDEQDEKEASPVESFFATMSSTLAAMENLVAAKEALAAAKSGEEDEEIAFNDDVVDEEAAEAADDAADDDEDDEPTVIIPPALSREEDSAKAAEALKSTDSTEEAEEISNEEEEEEEEEPIKDEEATEEEEAAEPKTETESEANTVEVAKEEENVTTTEEPEIPAAVSDDVARISDSIPTEEVAGGEETAVVKATSTEDIAAPSMDEGAVTSEVAAVDESATDSSPSEDEARLRPVEEATLSNEEEPSKDESVATEQTDVPSETEEPSVEEPVQPSAASKEEDPAAEETEASAAPAMDEATSADATPPEEATSSDPSSSVPEAEASEVEDSSPAAEVEDSDEIPDIDHIALSRDYDSESDADEVPQQDEQVIANQRDEPESDDPMDAIEHARSEVEMQDTDSAPALPESDSGSWFGWS